MSAPQNDFRSLPTSLRVIHFDKYFFPIITHAGTTLENGWVGHEGPIGNGRLSSFITLVEFSKSGWRR